MRIDVVLSLIKNQIIAAKPLEQFVSSSSKRKNKLLNFILRILGIILISSSFIFLLGSNYFGYLYISSSLNILNKGIAFCSFTATILLLFINTTFLEFTYFRGKDVNLWYLLPISKSEFFVSRFLVSYIYSLFTNIIITLPLIVAIIYFSGFSLLSLISSIFLFLLLPILPLIISSILVTLKVYIFKGKSIKLVDFLFNNGPFLVGILYISSSSNKMITMLSTNDLSNQANFYNEFISSIGSLPYFSSLGQMFFSSISLLLILLIVIIAFLISFFLISPLYHNCLDLIKSANDNYKKKKKVNNDEDTMKGSSLIISLIKRELFILQGEKGFLSESIGEALIPFILIIVWKITGSLDSINELIVMLSSSSYFIAGIFLIVQLFGAMVLISSTSISREGKLFKINKLLPIPVKKIIEAKVAFHLIFITLFQMIFLIIFVIFLKLDLKLLYWMIPLYLINSVNISLSGLFLDYNNPKLEWEVAISAMKRNMNGMIGMLVGLLVIAPSILILFFLYDYLFIAFALSIILLYVLWTLVNKAANKLIYQ